MSLLAGENNNSDGGEANSILDSPSNPCLTEANQGGASSTGADEDQKKRKRPKIALLPQAVVDQIAAGEVVQRPVSVVKELLENSLDAGATQIIVQFDGLSKMSITDNGRGIPRKDLELLCTRHATSKLNSLEDFSDLSTFGFRGEALASTSMVSRLLTVVTRLRVGEYDDDDDESGAAAYSQTYQNGKPLQKAPRPCARKVGTTITIEDLFYNVLHRQKAYSKREADEYGKIHKLVQDYAVHYPTVAFVCQRRMATGGGRNRGSHKQLVVDCNTGQIPAVKALLQSRKMARKQGKTDSHKEKILEATKQILSHVLESNVANHLLYMECNSSKSEETGSTPNDSFPNNEESPVTDNTTQDERSSRYKFRYAAEIYFTSPTYNSTNSNQKNQKGKAASSSQGKFILFLNHRLVDLPPLKRALEDVYADLGKQNTSVGKPVLVVNLQVPGCQVDVNVHPSKRQVALMHQEDLVQELVRSVRERLEDDGQAFVAGSVATKEQKPTSSSIRNPYAKSTTNTNITNTNKRKRSNEQSLDAGDQEEKKDLEDEDENDSAYDDETGSRGGNSNKSARYTSPTQDSTKTKPSSGSSSSKPKIAPSKMIRTNTAFRTGAIEPFLVSTQVSSQSQSQLTQDEREAEAPNSQQQQQSSTGTRIHVPSCPLSNPSSSRSSVDLSQPGAFATVLKQERCTCPTDDMDVNRRTVFVPSTIVRPKQVIPTPSKYTSIASLRKRVGKQQCHEITQKIRRAFYMGLMSHQRSLIQCGEELIMVNHLELAKELFYQLALARFGGGAKLAQLGCNGGNGGIRVQTVVAQALQCEDELILLHKRSAEKTDADDEEGLETNHNGILSRELLKVNNSNQNLAQHVTARLVESAPMLEEYFSIRIEIQHSSGEPEGSVKKKDAFDVTGDAILTGLPVLLDGHSPQPHALPMFLLRLATQVDWTREKHCFHGVCRELGNFYAMLPDDDLSAFVKHNLFPALSYLLLPSKNQAKNGHFTAMTKLSTLYKAFER